MRNVELPLLKACHVTEIDETEVPPNLSFLTIKLRLLL